MKKMSKKKVMIAVAVVFLLLALTGCQNNMNPDGTVKADKIIYLTTTWGEIFKTDGLFTTVIVYPLAQCINFLDQYVGIVLAIVLTTLIVNGVTYGFSVKSTVGMQKIQMLQPEMNRIAEKYANRNDESSKMRQAQELQALYAKHDVNPFSAMIVPFLQLPIMIAMYYAVQRAVAVVDGQIMGVSLSLTPMYGIKNGAFVLFFIYVLMAVAQFASSKIPTYLAEKRLKETKKKKSYVKEEKQAPNTNMMIYGMLIMMLVLAINWPTAMSLYWCVSSVINVVKTIYIQKRYVDHDA